MVVGLVGEGLGGEVEIGWMGMMVGRGVWGELVVVISSKERWWTRDPGVCQRMEYGTLMMGLIGEKMMGVGVVVVVVVVVDSGNIAAGEDSCGVIVVVVVVVDSPSSCCD